jgi:hypothetical protein
MIPPEEEAGFLNILSIFFLVNLSQNTASL